MASEKTRIGIIGAGAIGCVVGGLLARAGHDVTLVDAWPEHVEQIKTAGLRLSGSCGEHLVSVPALHLHELATVREPFEMVFVAVKSYDTEWATRIGVDHLPGGAEEAVAFGFGKRGEQRPVAIDRLENLGGGAQALGDVAGRRRCGALGIGGGGLLDGGRLERHGGRFYGAGPPDTIPAA